MESKKLESNNHSDVYVGIPAGNAVEELDESFIAVAKEIASDDYDDGIYVTDGAAQRFDLGSGGIFTEEELKTVKEMILENNRTVGLKDNCDGEIQLYADDSENDKKSRLDDVRGSDTVMIGDCMISVSKEKVSMGSHKNHVESETLGTFDYDPSQWAIGMKTVYDELGGKSVSTEMPALRYIGDQTNGNKIKIPDGVKSLDYTFEGNNTLESFPVIPDGVESLHCTFKNCVSLKMPCRDYSIDETWAGFLGGNHWFNLFGINKTYGRTGLDGTCILPDSVKDISYCFYQCGNLKNGFTDTTAGTELENMDSYADGCVNNETFLNVRAAKFLPVSAQTNAYNENNMANMRLVGSIDAAYDAEDGATFSLDENGLIKYGDTYCCVSAYANEGSVYSPGKNESNPYSADDLARKEAVETIQALRREERTSGGPDTQISNATMGLATAGTYKDKDGKTVYSDDITKTDAEREKSGFLNTLFGSGSAIGSILNGDSSEILQRIGFGAVEYCVLKKIVKNPWIAAGITVGGQVLGVLPGTIQGVGSTLRTIGGMFGSESQIGSILTSLGGRLAGNQSDGTVTAYSVSSWRTMEDAPDAGNVDAMAQSGRTAAETGSLQKAADVPEGTDMLLDVRTTAEQNMEAYSVALAEKLDETGQLSDAGKTEMAESSKTLLRGLQQYGAGAEEALWQNYGDDFEAYEKGKIGLEKIMRASVEPELAVIRGLNEKYEFLSESDIAELDSLRFAGLDGVSFSNYDPEKNYASVDEYGAYPDVDLDDFDAYDSLEANAFFEQSVENHYSDQPQLQHKSTVPKAVVSPVQKARWTAMSYDFDDALENDDELSL